MLGLHPLDAAILLGYLVLILWIGHRVGARTQNRNEFFLAGRRLGGFYQFFLNFGTSTNADQAVAVSREIYRQGIGGMWIQYLVLFITPFYWFQTLFFRRVRLTTIGDYFTERFQSPCLGGAFAIFILLVSIVGGGAGFMVAGKTFMAVTPKVEAEWTADEREQVLAFREFRELSDRLESGLTTAERGRWEELNERNKLGQLVSFASHTDPLVFYIVFALVVSVYTMLGGFRAAAVTDAIQGALIVLFSLILIPIGLSRIGGFAGLHATVPDFMFDLFGSAALSDYGGPTIVAMILANLVSIIAVATGMQTAGSARDEMTARLGMIGGMFFKRFIMLFWALAGLLAIGLYAGDLHDPDLIWGYMTRDLLAPGAIGLMMVGVLAANMSTLDATSVSYSALFIRNLYEPLRPGRTEAHYLMIGRLVIPLTLAGGVLVAVFVNDLLELFRYFISIPAIFGASIWLGFIWRGLTRMAVMLQVVICVAIYAIIPNLFAAMDWSRHDPGFLAMTRAQTIEVDEPALATDVAAGRALRVGESIARVREVPPAAIFFDQVARENPADPASPRVGLGRFNAEIWVLSWFGFDFRETSRSWLVALRFFFDALFPFVLLFLFSALTAPVAPAAVERFFAKLRTPVQPTAALDAAALEGAYADPRRFEDDKIFPGSAWEVMKPGRIDYLGFGGSWVLVGVVVLLLWLMVNIR
ncbi:MAG: sodium:solute symporter family protein [Vicinamibacterales bacterium]|jgi:SSS family solute:Na+ symporter|nr:sodium:solute symporter family protein [Vicinamibacterales bacterium]MDP7472106.1 sodium:solute symporter family protein [Vicinamibacterales bacterium]HJO37285.1 sodium:solute symporter family protein [Vicinamibacterales bacterium]